MTSAAERELLDDLAAFAMLGGDSPPDVLYQELGIKPEVLSSALGAPWRVFLLPDDLAGYRKHMHGMRADVRRPFKEAQGRTAALRGDDEIRRAGILSSLVLPALTRACVSFTRAEARHRLGQLAVAVASCRARTGQFPAKLEDLVPDHIAEIPADPFDDQPLRWRSSATGVTVYSIGEDLTDDGGAIPLDTATGKGDIIFRVGAAQNAGKLP